MCRAKVLLVGITASGALLLVTGRYKVVEVGSTLMVAAFTVSTIVAMIALQWTPYRVSSAQSIDGLKFQMPASFTVAFAAFGITGVGASELIYYPYWCLEKGYARHIGPRDDTPDWRRRMLGWLRVLHTDAALSMLIYTGATIAFYILGAAVLHGQGLQVTDRELIETLGQMYRQTLGATGAWIFLIGAFAVLYSTFFVATASNARLFADAAAIFGVAHYPDEAARLRVVRAACVVLPMASGTGVLSVSAAGAARADWRCRPGAAAAVPWSGGGVFSSPASLRRHPQQYPVDIRALALSARHDARRRISAGADAATVPMNEPGIDDVHRARARIDGVIRRTPLMRHPLLAAETGLDIYVKHENHNPTGAFKIRGGLNLVASLSDHERARGVITASTGNHGQSIAFASQRTGVSCIVAVPRGNNPEKNAAMRAFGATVVEEGKDFDEAREWVEREAEAGGRRYVHSANEPLLIAGVGTYGLEIFEDLPDADVILVPIGGGSGACGCCIARTGLAKKARIIGVQAMEADAFTRSWRGPERVSAERVGTFAEGLATRYSFDLTFGILKRELDDIVTLSEAELEGGVRLALRTTHNLAEGAGAASLAAAVKLRDQLAGRRVVCVMSGGNISMPVLQRILHDA